jgi:cytochrome c oxidase subunit 2
MGYLETFGPRADPITALTWGVIVISVAVTVVVTVLVITGALARRRGHASDVASLPVESGPPALAWIWAGVAFTLVALTVTLVWTVRVLAETDSPAHKPALVIEVTGYQWWWGAAYPGDRFATANEIHIPTGQPVLIRLKGADVIHSFWIPSLTGKTDTIPGRTNIAWLQADRPGVYRGQCTEYCGVQHAHMTAYVVAQSPADFAAWRAAQAQPATAPATPDAIAGEQVFASNCAVCHTVRGTDASGEQGPDLTHLMSRSTLAAGTLPNNPNALIGWIANPQALKPGTHMPATYLTPRDLAHVRAYLETLK